jgi:hypothetical protein
VNIQSSTPSSVYLISAPSSTPNAVYDFQVSKDGAAFVSLGTATTTRNRTFPLPAGPGTYTFQVVVTAPAPYAGSATRAAVGSVVIAAKAIAPAYLNIQTKFPATGKVYLISAPAPQVGVSYVFSYSSDGGTTWSAGVNTGATRNPTITIPGPPTGKTYIFRVLVTGGGFTDSNPVQAAGNFVY